MRRILLFSLMCLIVYPAAAQEVSVFDFFSESFFSSKKLESYLRKREFNFSDQRWQGSVLVKEYRWSPKKKKLQVTDVSRKILVCRDAEYLSFSYNTTSRIEFDQSLEHLKQQNFFCGRGLGKDSLLFQKGNISVLVTKRELPADTSFSYFVKLQSLTPATRVRFADDLLQFNSHEELAFVFGRRNVMKDIYYLSETEWAKCTILFPRTNKQAVFVWEDQENLQNLNYVLIGGNLNTANLSTYDGFIEENSWSTREGVYSGMSLGNLVRLNGRDIKFYGLSSQQSYVVLPGNSGDLNFNNTRFILGCLNPTASGILKNEIISANDIMNENAGVYVSLIKLTKERK